MYAIYRPKVLSRMSIKRPKETQNQRYLINKNIQRLVDNYAMRILVGSFFENLL